MSTFEIDQGTLQSWVLPGGIVEQDMARRARAVVFEAQVRAPVRTGALRASAVAKPATDAEVLGAWDAVFNIYYAWFVDQGTRFMDPRLYLSLSIGSAIR